MHFLEIRVFLGLILAILWPKVMNNYGVPKIRVFLHPEMLEFRVVGEFSCWGCKLEIDVPNFISFCYWKGAKFNKNNNLFNVYIHTIKSHLRVNRAQA